MKQVYRIDNNGFYVEPSIVQEDEELANDLVEMVIQEGFYKPKFDGQKWVEGLTQSEIETLRSQPQPKSELEELKLQQELMQKALDDIIFSVGGF
jgi:hypothetical protein